VTIRLTLAAVACPLSVSALRNSRQCKEGRHLTRGNLTTALQTLAKETGTEFIYSSEQLKDIQTQGVDEQEPHPALQTLREQTVRKKVMQVFEADIRSDFTRINRQWLRKMVAHRIADPVILRLIGRWLNAGAMQVTSTFTSYSTCGLRRRSNQLVGVTRIWCVSLMTSW